MQTITLRKIPSEITKKIERKARETHTSINRTVIQLLEESVGTKQPLQKKQLYHDLDHLAGSWTKQELKTFQKNLTQSRKIDLELWR